MKFDEGPGNEIVELIECDNHQALPVRSNQEQTSPQTKGDLLVITWTMIIVIDYVAEARDWTNLKIPKADADCSTKTPPRIEIT